MRLFSYLADSVPAIGVKQGSGAVALSSLGGFPTDLTALIAGGEEVLTAIDAMLRQGDGAAIDLNAVKILAPFPSPPKIICIGLNYQDHAAETNLATTAFPTVFTRFASTIVAHDEALLRPRVSSDFDYEVELVAVIGKIAHYVSKDEALRHVAGYTVGNDASLRDYQFKTSQFTIGKNFDATCGLGPDFVTADELPAGGKGLSIATRLNGETVQSQSTSDMIFDVATLVHLLSETMTLDVGTIILTGTPSGIGMARKPPLYMKQGDICECEVENVGLLRNLIRDEI